MHSRIEPREAQDGESGSEWDGAEDDDHDGYMPDMIVSNNAHCVVPPPNNQSRFRGGTDKDCGEQIELHVVHISPRDLGLIDE
jgi:hypothetical protein